MGNSILEKVKEAEVLFAGYEITGQELERVKSLREKLEDHHMTVSVIGQFKRGKSALVNRILEDDILPVGIVPVTAVVTAVDYGPKSAQVHFSNGLVKEVAFEEISGYVNEQENSDNHLNVTKVAIHSPSPFLEKGLTFVDTPGVGSMHEKNSKEAYDFVKESDAVIFTLSVDSPINSIEIDFLRNAKEYAAKFYFAVNKIDAVEQKDLEAYTSYCKRFIADLMETEAITLFPVSAKTGQGVEDLKTAVKADLEANSSRILEESTKLKLHDIVISALSQITLYRNALSLTGVEFESKFSEIKDFSEGLVKETAGLPQALKENDMVMKAHTNDVRNRLASKVKELFGIEYHYHIDDIKSSAVHSDMAGGQPKGPATIEAQVEEICQSLIDTLNEIFMFREENTYIVARRINDLNRLVRRLVRMRDGRE